MTLRDESRWPSMWGAGQDPARLPVLDATAQPVEEEWRYNAACAGTEDLNLFFPVGTGADAIVQTEAAKAVCGPCPVRAECLTFALDTDQYGVWGGMSEDERRELKQKARRTT
jgi:WhiB family redox-sensing transcriptional regulator